MLIIFLMKTVLLLFHLRICTWLEIQIKTRQYKRKEVRVVLLHWRPNSGHESRK